MERRALKPEEIRQIAGRAGRFGMYSKGYVGATQNLELIRAGLEAVVPPLQYAVVGFSDLVLQVDFDLLEVLTQWNQMPTVEPYRKLDITRYIAIISKMREMGFLLSKEQELRAANIPFDDSRLAPAPGVYATKVTVEGKVFLGGTNVGTKPTFGDEKPSVETFILDFDGDIYGHDMEVAFYHRLREERKRRPKGEQPWKKQC